MGQFVKYGLHAKIKEIRHFTVICQHTKADRRNLLPIGVTLHLVLGRQC